MPSFQTISRAVVMVGVGVIAVKGWHAYGPTNAQLARAYNQVKDVVQASLPNGDEASATAPADPRLAPPKLSAATPPLAPMSGAQSQVLPPTMPTTAPAEAPKLLPGTAPTVGSSSPFPTSGAPLSKDTFDSNSGDPRVNELIARLQRLGAENASLAPWGNGGLYRFSCSAPLANAPMMTQHFESVAAEPALAVEQVVAKVEAWRVAQRDGSMLLRY